MRNLAFLLFGAIFGFTLSRVDASNYDLIFDMFTGQNLKLAFVIGTAIVTAFIGMRLLAAMGNRTIEGQIIKVNKKPLNKFNAIGGMIFGIGWAVFGACPGTVLAQIGEGKVLGLFTFAGIVFGTYLFALLVEHFPSLSNDQSPILLDRHILLGEILRQTSVEYLYFSFLRKVGGGFLAGGGQNGDCTTKGCGQLCLHSPRK